MNLFACVWSCSRKDMCIQFKVTKEDLQPFPGLHKNLAHCNMVHMLWENFCNVYEILPQLQEPLCHTVSVCLTTSFKGKMHQNKLFTKDSIVTVVTIKHQCNHGFRQLAKTFHMIRVIYLYITSQSIHNCTWQLFETHSNWNLEVEPHSNSHGDIEYMKDWHSQTW